MFRTHYQKMIDSLKQQKAQLTQELELELEQMPPGVRRSQKDFELKKVRIELANYLEAQADRAH